MGKRKKTRANTGWDCYDKETCAGKNVFTLRAARKYDIDTLQKILDYMVNSDMDDEQTNEKCAHSLLNVLKAMKEKTEPPTEEEIQRLKQIFTDLQREHRAFDEEEE